MSEPSLQQFAFRQTKGGVALPGKGPQADEATPTPSMSAAQAEKVLAAFDLDFAFGPSVGLSRAERFERAQQLGLSPPAEVRIALSVTSVAAESVFSRAMGMAA